MSFGRELSIKESFFDREWYGYPYEWLNHTEDSYDPDEWLMHTVETYPDPEWSEQHTKYKYPEWLKHYLIVTNGTRLLPNFLITGRYRICSK